MANELRILVIDDEAPIRKFLRVSLEGAGYSVVEAEDGARALEQIATQSPTLVLLDLGLPDLDGLAVLARLREWSGIPVIILSAREQEGDKVAALDLGADDYLTKPFGVSELLARIRANLRRVESESESEGRYSFGGVEIDFAARVVSRGGVEIHLTPIEYKLMLQFIRHRGKVLTHRQLLTEVWGKAFARETQYLRVFMKQLRTKLEQDPAKPEFFLTETGVGYRFSPPTLNSPGKGSSD